MTEDRAPYRHHGTDLCGVVSWTYGDPNGRHAVVYDRPGHTRANHTDPRFMVRMMDGREHVETKFLHLARSANDWAIYYVRNGAPGVKA